MDAIWFAIRHLQRELSAAVFERSARRIFEGSSHSYYGEVIVIILFSQFFLGMECPPSHCEHIFHMRTGSYSCDAPFKSGLRNAALSGTYGHTRGRSETDRLLTSVGIIGSRMSQRLSLRSSPPIRRQAALDSVVRIDADDRPRAICNCT